MERKKACATVLRAAQKTCKVQQDLVSFYGSGGLYILLKTLKIGVHLEFFRCSLRKTGIWNREMGGASGRIFKQEIHINGHC